MHSPPPTPATTRKLGGGKIGFALPMSRGASGSDVEPSRPTSGSGGDGKEGADSTDLVTRKRTREQAGLATPRPTPAKQRIAPAAAGIRSDRPSLAIENGTAKVLFPGRQSSSASLASISTSSRSRSNKGSQFDVYQDAGTDAATHRSAIDEASNPFTAPSVVAGTSTRDRSRRPPERRGHAAVAAPVAIQPPGAPRLPAALSMDPSQSSADGTSTTATSDASPPKRDDGVYMVFRGKRVFRPHASAAEKEHFDSLQPRKLFEAQLSGQVLDRAFGDEDEEHGPGGTVGEEDMREVERALSAGSSSSDGRGKVPSTRRRLF